MKRYLLGALAVGLTLVGVWACGSSSENDDLCTEEGGYCTASSSCTAVLPFGCGTSGNVCCQNGTSTGPTPVSSEDSGSTPVTTTDSGTTPVTTTDSGPTTTTDSGPTTTTDSGAKDSGPATDSGAKDSGPATDAGSKDAAKD